MICTARTAELLKGSVTVTTSPISPELQSQIQIWRQKSADGTITLPEMRQAVILMRGGRTGAQEAAASAGKSKAAKKPVRKADDMLAELGAL